MMEGMGSSHCPARMMDCLHEHVYTHTDTHAHTHTRAHTHTHVHAHIHRHTCTHTHAQRCTHTHRHTHRHRHTHTHRHTDTHTHAHTDAHTHVHKHTDTPIHTYTHTHTQSGAGDTAKQYGRTHQGARKPSKGHEGFGASTVRGPLLAAELFAEASRPLCPALLLLEAPVRGGSTLSHVPQVMGQRPVRH